MMTIRSVLWSLRYAALITPLGLLSVATAVGRPEPTAQRWERLAARTLGARSDARRRPSAAGAFGHAVVSVLLGVVAWILLLAIVTMIARGALYGLFDRGPYDTSWGGPSLAGAWLAHFAVSIPGVVLAVLLTSGVTRLHRYLTQRLQGAAAPGWALPAVMVVCAATALLVAAWSRQL